MNKGIIGSDDWNIDEIGFEIGYEIAQIVVILNIS